MFGILSLPHLRCYKSKCLAFDHFLDKDGCGGFDLLEHPLSIHWSINWASIDPPGKRVGIFRGAAEGRGNAGLKFTDFVETWAGLDGGLVLSNSARDPNGITDSICWLWGVDTSLALAFTKGSFSVGKASKLWLFVFTPRTQSFSLDGKSHLLKYFSVIGKTFWHTFRRL